MDSLSTNLTPFDDYNIYCKDHDKPALGVCGEYLCKERRFFCMVCVRNEDICITNQHHELISLSELLYRFFIKQETKAIDLVEINSMMESLKEMNQSEIKMKLSEFSQNLQNKLEKSLKNFSFLLQDKINQNKISINTMLHKIKINESDLKEESDNLHFLANQNIPECLLKFNIKNVNEYLKSTLIKMEEKQSILKLIKYISNKEKSNKTINTGSQLISLHNSTKQEKVSQIAKVVDEKIAEIETKINLQLDQLEKILLPSTSEGLILKNSNQKFTGDPAKLTFKMDICTTSHKANSIDSVFTAFKSIKGNSYVVWGTPSHTIEVYDLKLEIVKTIPAAHLNTIFSCRHYLDKKNKTDYVITSSYDRSVKVWNVSDNWNCVVTITNAHTGYYIYSVCILCNEIDNKNYIISAAPNEFSKIWEFSGKHVKDFGINTESTYFINSWFDSKNKKYYIINGNSTDVKAYEFKTGAFYKSFKGTPQTWHMSALINEVNNIPQLIESDGNGNVRVWDFHQGTLLKTISTSGINLRGICLWNDNYVISSGSDYTVKIFDLKNGKSIKSLSGHTSTACAVEKIFHPIHGESLITHALDGKLKLWILK